MGEEIKLPHERDLRDYSSEELLKIGKAVLVDEAKALMSCADTLGNEIVDIARLVASCKGRVVVSGVGKSGLVGRKISATLASLGVPSIFLHAAEAAHGDLGMVCRDDVVLFISKSGETAELINILPTLKHIDVPIIAVAENENSTLAKSSDIFLNCYVEKEAEPLDLAPTSSTTVQMSLGDAIATIATFLLSVKKEDFALFHPGGLLGKRLLLKVSDLMGTGDKLPITNHNVLVRDALFDITSKGYGATAIVDDDGYLIGVFTDGDLRRLIEKNGIESLDSPVINAMTKNPRVISPNKLAVEAVRIVEEWEVSAIIIVENGKPVGMVHIHEILKAGVA